MNARNEQVEQLFELCRVLAPAERAAYLLADGVPSEVEREVRALLEAYDQSASFLEEPVLERQAATVQRLLRQAPEIAAGTRIGHYEIVGPLGAGGMGIVYRARDTRLGREVALKMLPPALAGDAARRARFQTEARALAALNHQNIGGIYGFEAGVLVLELVEGLTLAERMEAGRVPFGEVLEIATQIAGGLEAAHERGITHRDLKPSNVKLTPAGTVKLLDFGLAKATAPISGDGVAAGTGERLADLSLPGMVLGTAGYMAPEQAAGEAVDQRADVWAFGVVVHEMLTGSRPFDGRETGFPSGKSGTETGSGALPGSTPPVLRELLRRCLEPNPKKRLRDMREARLTLEALVSGEAGAAWAGADGGRVWPWAAAVLMMTTVGLGLALWQAWRPEPRRLIRLSVALGEDALQGLNTTVAISPDGTRLVYPVRRAEGGSQLATRLLEDTKASILTGTEGGGDPFFSPDGRWIGFFAGRLLKKISVNGGTALTLCGTDGAARGAAWGSDGFIIANLDNRHLARVPEGGGTPETLAATPEDHGEVTWRWPQILPGGEYVLFTGSRGAGTGEGYEDANIEAVSLKTGRVTVLHRGGYFGRYVPSGHLIYVHRRTLFAVGLDAKSLTTRGTPVPVLDDVAGAVGQAAGQLDFSGAGGIFVYLAGKAPDPVRTLHSIDATGAARPVLKTTAGITPSLSPDGKFLAVSTMGDVLSYDLRRGQTTRITSNSLLNSTPVWTPDGKHIVYSQRGGGVNAIWWTRSDGSGQPHKLFETAEGMRAHSFSPDGRWLALSRQHPVTAWDIWMLPLDLSDPERPKTGRAAPFLEERRNQDYPMFSPDGRWVAFASEVVGGATEVIVRPFPDDASGREWRVSNDGGKFPVWSRQGRELYFLGKNDINLMRVSYTVSGGAFAAQKPQQWTPAPLLLTETYRNFDVTPDGKRILAFPGPPMEEPERKLPVHVTLLLNFFEELKRRVP